MARDKIFFSKNIKTSNNPQNYSIRKTQKIYEKPNKD